MHEKKPRRAKVWLRPRLRVMRGSEIALGPGRVDLLELIRDTGSLRAAAERMGISYMRAWHLVKYTNRWFNTPLVEVVRGGKTGGGAKLTRAGHRMVALYRKMEVQCQQAVKANWRGIQRLLG
jgi:molybdate transport system regulatory protein